MNRLLIFLGICCLLLVACTSTPPVSDVGLHRLVDPLIGTGISTVASAVKHAEAGNESKAQTFPAVGTPFGMTYWTPQTHATEQKCYSPYYHFEKKIQGFRGSHWMSGSCTQDYGSVTIMPMTGALRTGPEQRASAFSHQEESAQAGYYSVRLADYDILVEMTAGTRSGMLRMDFQGDTTGFLVVEPNSDEGEAFVAIDPERKEIVGYNPVHRIYQGWGEPAGFAGYFVIQLAQPFAAYGTWADSLTHAFNPRMEGQGLPIGAYVEVNAGAGPLLVKVGTSFSSIEQARKNLEAEIPAWDFEGLRRTTEAAWDDALGRVAVAGGAPSQDTMFYTALYHSFLLPRTFSDVDGTYPAFAGGDSLMVAQDFTYYADFSMWDTYRAVQPLDNLLHPSRARDMMRSLVAKAEQGGWLPIFPAWNHYTAAMIGDHVISVLGDAYIKGVIDFDMEPAYRYMRQNAFLPNPDYESYVAGKGRRALQPYLDLGYVPMEEPVREAFHKNEQASRTLEYAYDDFVLARVAEKLGKTEDAKILFQRALNYRHVIDSQGYARGRHADGSWVKPFDPVAKRAPFITEGSPFQYTWYVPHDPAGLMAMMGGEGRYLAQLDRFFEEKHYWHGNEPSHQVPYLYAYGGAPWKTQALIPEIIAAEYGTGPGGISGNDDAGQMSAWLAFSMMGFYPVCPGEPVYVMGIPAFESVQLNLENGKTFRIEAVGLLDGKGFIQSATLNGQALDHAYLTHGEILAGGRLVLTLGDAPNPDWGSADRPPSLSGQQPGDNLSATAAYMGTD